MLYFRSHDYISSEIVQDDGTDITMTLYFDAWPGLEQNTEVIKHDRCLKVNLEVFGIPELYDSLPFFEILKDHIAITFIFSVHPVDMMVLGFYINSRQ